MIKPKDVQSKLDCTGYEADNWVMATAKSFTKCALVVGILSSYEEGREELLQMLEKEFGPLETQSPVMDFPYTDYYDDEMGGRPVRYLLLFRNLVDPACLASFKILTNSMEKHFSFPDGRRRINIDPGILSLSSFILATCKDRSHRIPLRDGVYGETTLIYQDKDFQRLPWTYADYSSDEVRAVLRDFRTRYRDLLKNN